MYTALNLTGLSVGLACCIIILLYINHEFSYDKFHHESEKIFRVVQKLREDKSWAWTGGGMAPILRQEFKELQAVVSLHRMSTLVTYEHQYQGRQVYREDNFIFADPDFFSVFDFPLAKGSIGNALEEPYTLFITESTAKRIFGDEDPLGKILSINGDHAFTVTGVLRDIPSNSHIQFDFLSGMASFKATAKLPLNADFTSHWWPSVWTYIRVDDPTSAQVINQTLPEIMKKHRDSEEVKRFTPALQSLTSIHLHSDMDNEISPNGNISTVYTFLSIAVFTLVLACINFINLSTARAVKRAKEVGIRKTFGANKEQLVKQFFLESFFMNLVGLLIALVLVESTIPAFNDLTQQNLSLALFQDRNTWLIILSVILISSFLSGFYPAVYLSHFQTIKVLKGITTNKVKMGLRKGLVFFQFALSAIVLFCTSVAYFQVDYLRDVNLGFEKEHTLILRTAQTSRKNYDILRDKLNESTLISDVTGTSSRPGVDKGHGPQVEFEGLNPIDRPFIFQQHVDYNYFEMMNIPVVAGRSFSKEYNDEGVGTLMRGRFPAYENRNFVINEEAVRFLGKTNETVIGMPLRVYTEENEQLFSDVKGVVVGVIKDFNTTSLHDKIQPTAFSPIRNNFGNETRYVLVKLTPGKFSEALAEVEKIWKTINENEPFEYTFLDKDLQHLYAQETRLGNITGIFSLLTLFISCLGLFGLSAYTAESRTKEIGIRKVLGASERRIIILLSKDYLILVIAAIFLASPIAWLIMDHWLENFAYQVRQSVWIPIVIGLFSVTISFLTISFQSIKAAVSNPTDSLRNE
jgi:putative ABC transport system permease protein